MGNGASNDVEVFQDGQLELDLKKHGGKGDSTALKLLAAGYDKIISSVIRPECSVYDVSVLGADEFQHACNHTRSGNTSTMSIRHKTFTITNDRMQSLVCSHWQIYPNPDSSVPSRTPCLVYLHSNIGSRVDVLRIRNIVLECYMSVMAFDFSGSGQSDGAYVTMGWNESKDLQCVLEHLDADESVESICIYAHSMGVYPALVEASKRSPGTNQAAGQHMDVSMSPDTKKHVRGLVIDGGYCAMMTLIQEMMVQIQQEGFAVPLSLLKLGCSIVRKTIQTRAQVDLKSLRPIDFVQYCNIPALFMTGKDDRYVASHHSHDLAAKYSGPSVVLQVEGGHYDLRPRKSYVEAVHFLQGAIHSKWTSY
uniref:Serine protease family S09X putative n=1 Tax=Albugo laibachii Nc14 TaxID=890382 RepID=F0WQY8_9STRA|nr:serine protease family S09X putative [Albugo laibachii Nc14]|eukprot:CCA23748.1 serine protease family S09X putative [Albugo laibachii Nc14]